MKRACCLKAVAEDQRAQHQSWSITIDQCGVSVAARRPGATFLLLEATLAAEFTIMRLDAPLIEGAKGTQEKAETTPRNGLSKGSKRSAAGGRCGPDRAMSRQFKADAPL
eukprot:CAMPEP_0172836582 /NCGR_PEP_ID=MMETSP1075-20121228/26579_1 /TAXON_ID=2916 /ORGANISM="Ceratium fusus, Strain PA161109" /LENGTH=109 /DNA_ID=CAMNT_0013679825 /DNA_START=1465 /DNA_END=1792 /DNA_ORIENTATION=+